MKAPRDMRASELKKNSDASSRETKIAHANKLVQGFAESRSEKDFITLVQTRRNSALKGNNIEVDVGDL